MNMAVPVSARAPPFSSFGDMLRSAIAGSFDNSVFNFFKRVHVLKKNTATVLLGFSSGSAVKNPPAMQETWI